MSTNNNNTRCDECGKRVEHEIWCCMSTAPRFVPAKFPELELWIATTDHYSGTEEFRFVPGMSAEAALFDATMRVRMSGQFYSILSIAKA